MALSFMVNVFDVHENKQVMLKSEYKCFFVGRRVTENLPLCAFVIKLGALEHMLTRFYQACVYNSVKYCASHFDNQKLVDSMIIKLRAASHSQLISPLTRPSTIFYNYVSFLNIKLLISCILVSFM
ncbi:DUF3514 domain-containing protein [Ehrlichia japonica]|uniref:Uncharacterized protein n=1 Tax=Ehrlichia japonica TaxID=391036 RepID=X5GIQ8_9RICK|nr:DUF3514 domain-containing protein [Ehrlichia japonica]AHX04333.1 hypothetical protein EHF_0944 [Ehrlichia japonica]